MHIIQSLIIQCSAEGFKRLHQFVLRQVTHENECKKVIHTQNCCALFEAEAAGRSVGWIWI